MSGFSVEELAAIPDEALVDAVLGVVSASGAGLDEEALVQILDASPSGFGIVHSVSLLDLEVRNGGFHQYFWNRKQLHVPMTRKALATLGATEHLAVFEDALRLVESEPVAPSRGDPEAVLRAFSASAIASHMDSLDSRWYRLPEVGPMLVAFIRANPAAVWEED